MIIINPDQTIAWANQSALEMHGIQWLKDFGATVSEYRERFESQYRNRHKLPPGEHPMDRVVAGEAFSEVVVEVVRPGEKMQQIRSLAIHDTSGHLDCLVLVIEDETERFDAEQRFERASGANPTPAIIARLSDYRYAKVNEGFLELTGFVRKALVGRSMHEIDVLAGAMKRDLATESDLSLWGNGPARDELTRLPNQTGRLHNADTMLRTKNGSASDYVLSAETATIHGEDCVLTVMLDISARKQTETELLAAIASVMQTRPCLGRKSSRNWPAWRVMARRTTLVQEPPTLRRGPARFLA